MRYVNDSTLLTHNNGDSVIVVASLDGRIRHKYRENDRKNIGSHEVAFRKTGNDYVFPFSDTNAAFVYHTEADTFGVIPVTQSAEQLLGPETLPAIAAEMTNPMPWDYGNKALESNVFIYEGMRVGDQVILRTFWPDRKQRIHIAADGGQADFELSREWMQVVNDLTEEEEMVSIVTFGNYDSEDSFMFRLDADNPDDNPRIIEVTRLKLPGSSH